MAINDIYSDGIRQGWRVIDASSLTAPQTFEADVAIIGTGAGGGTSAEILAAAGFKVILLEEGPLKTAASFKDMDEARAMRELYQEAGGRATADGAIAILQGRSVGGTTTVNWTSSFKTPPETLKNWQEVHGVKGVSAAEMAPWFAQMEQRLGISPWAQAPNANNAALKVGCEKLGWEWHVIPRNVKGCWNTGYCGFGCPANAKQSMLVSTIPAALQNGATLVHHLRVQRLIHKNDAVIGLEAKALSANTLLQSGPTVTVRAKHYILAGGAINNPALLLRSNAPDPHQRIGKRTFVHPVVLALAQMPDKIDGYYGAPQTIASDHFQWQGDFNRSPGFKLEVPPMQPALTSTIFSTHGADLGQDSAQLPYLHATLALLRDGFHPESTGGSVRIDSSGEPLLDYVITDYLWRGMEQAYLRMQEAQFAAGAKRVRPAHLDAKWVSTWAEAKAQTAALPYKNQRVSVFTAHLMGGCSLGEDPKTSVVNSMGSHHQLANLSIIDGSVFPTSIGANPQLSIYGLSARNATALVQRLGKVG